jgi:hypothetical protein
MDKWHTFAQYVLEKENIGLVSQLFIRPSLPLHSNHSAQPCVAFDVLVGYYRTVIQPEVQRIEPPLVMIDTPIESNTTIDKLSDGARIRVRTYF